MAAGDDEPMPEAPPAKAPRRFAPQLVEESVKSSNRKPDSDSPCAPASKSSATDETMTDPMAPPAAKPKRRFAPQLVEESSSSSSNNKRPADAPLSTHSSNPTTRRTTRDASVQVNDMEMPDAPTQASSASSSMSSKIRRFAPIPIETTYDSYRVNRNSNPYGPTAELTPEHSPTLEQQSPPQPQPSVPGGGGRLHKLQNSKPEAKPKKKFAPQLIETTRRARRAGQDGPATRPTDKTDITPGTNHIYAPKTKRKPGGVGGIGSRTADDSGVARSSPRAKPSPGPGEDGTALTPSSWALNPAKVQQQKWDNKSASFAPDLDTIISSESEDEGEAEAGGSVPALDVTGPDEEGGTSWKSRKPSLRDRRESCDEESSGYLLALAAREADARQRALEQVMSAFPNGLQPAPVEHFFVRDNSEDESYLDMDEPLRHGPSQLIRRKSTDPGWAVKEMRAHHEKLDKQRGVDSSEATAADVAGDAMDVDTVSQGPAGTREPEVAPPVRENTLWTTQQALRRGSQDRRGSMSPYLMRDPERRSSTSPYLVAQSPVVRGRATSRSPNNDPSSVLGPPAAATPPDPFRPSPFGVPRGFRHELDEEEKMRKSATPPMLGSRIRFRRCPSPKHTRMEPDHPYQLKTIPRLYEDARRDDTESTGLWRGYCSARANETVVTALQALPLLSTPDEQSNPNADPFAASFDAHMGPTKRSSLHGKGAGVQDASPMEEDVEKVDDKEEELRREEARQQREKFLSGEFDAGFVTQVYNYISLGYPAMARAFDEELSKISGIDMATLRRDDRDVIKKGFMLEAEMTQSKSEKKRSTHKDDGNDSAMLSPEEDEARDKDKPPRWKALRLYIMEWGRQHPNLGDDDNPLAWGVRARRGSWAF